MTRRVVLVAIHHQVLAWTIDTEHVDRLRHRFPHITFLHSLNRDQDVEFAKDAEIAFALSLRSEAVARAEPLRWIHSSAHAVNHFPLATLRSRGVIVTNSRGIQAAAIAEHTLAGLLALARGLRRTIQDQSSRVWAPNEFSGSAAPWLLTSKTLCLVGLGTLGEAIALRARAFGMRVIAVRRRPERGGPPCVDRVVGPENLLAALAQADVVVLAAPSTSETNRLLDVKAIEALKPGAVVVNVSRGQLIDEEALVAALVEGRLGGAVLDVFATEPLPADSPLWGLPNVLVTPHMAGFRANHFDDVVALFAENLERYERGQELLNLVDLTVGY